MAIVTYNDNGTIKVVKFGTRVVSTDADPVVQRQWVFLHEAESSGGTSIQHELTGIQDENQPGCGSTIGFCEELTSLFNPNDRAIGTRAAIRMNSAVGGSTCDTWAIFEVQAVIENYVRFVSAETRTITPKYTNSDVTLQYSINAGATWTTISSGSVTTSAKEHWFRGQATGTRSLFTGEFPTNSWAFSGESVLEVYGNLNYLLCTTLGDEVAPTSLGAYAYAQMFGGCTSLTVAPELPATTLANKCYGSMFSTCRSLTTAPKLPATTLANYCYGSMFRNCTSLTVVPELPATTLTEGCYNKMFSDCTSFKVSETEKYSYTHAWRIPTSGTGVEATYWNQQMLTDTGGTFTGSPNINTTYYVENKPVSADADPVVQKQWVFLNGAATPGKNVETFENTGLFDSAYESQGCAAPSVLLSALDSQYPASAFSIGTKAAIKMNGVGQTCNTWALFEIQKV